MKGLALIYDYKIYSTTRSYAVKEGTEKRG
jgi:hypothetical protein